MNALPALFIATPLALALVGAALLIARDLDALVRRPLRLTALLAGMALAFAAIVVIFTQAHRRPALTPPVAPPAQPAQIAPGETLAPLPHGDPRQYADVEVACLAFAVFVEARGESIEGQLAVAESILQRTRLTPVRLHVCEVVLADGQYEGMARWPAGQLPVDVDPQAWFIAIMVTDVAMRGHLRTECHGSTSFFNHFKVIPDWALGRDACVIGNHTFVTP